jgi:LPS sulfotransferase NodH
MRYGMALYLCEGIRPGDFLYAVLSNDLKSAVLKADHINKDKLADYVGFLYMSAEHRAWWSEEKVEAWLQAAAEKREKEAEN